MTISNDLKIWMRSGSWEFAWGKPTGNTLEDVRVYRWKGIPIHYRLGTTDKGAIYEILIRPEKSAEYHVPKYLRPDVILDIGGHIGTASIFLANRFPNAQIYTFEPLPDNFFLLSKNLEQLGNVKAFPFALGDKEGEFDIYTCEDETNLGGYSLHDRPRDSINAGIDLSKQITVEVKPVSNILADLRISKIDLIKIDTEGSEFDILTSIDPDILGRIQWIMGELHGVRDFELLAYLSKWFDLELHKKLDSHLFLFHARNKTVQNR